MSVGNGRIFLLIESLFRVMKLAFEVMRSRFGKGIHTARKFDVGEK